MLCPVDVRDSFKLWIAKVVEPGVPLPPDLDVIRVGRLDFQVEERDGIDEEPLKFWNPFPGPPNWGRSMVNLNVVSPVMTRPLSRQNGVEEASHRVRLRAAVALCLDNGMSRDDVLEIVDLEVARDVLES